MLTWNGMALKGRRVGMSMIILPLVLEGHASHQPSRPRLAFLMLSSIEAPRLALPALPWPTS